MPIFNRFYRRADGQLSPEGLRAVGAFLNVEVRIPEALAKLLAARDEPQPQPEEGVALIDTGASRTCVHEPVLKKLGVNPVGLITTGTAGGRVQQPLYPARLSFPGEQMQAEFGSVIAVDLTGQKIQDKPIIALIGRDILALTLFIYNGRGGFFSIAT